jgi:hypothetical protein
MKHILEDLKTNICIIYMYKIKDQFNLLCNSLQTDKQDTGASVKKSLNMHLKQLLPKKEVFSSFKLTNLYKCFFKIAPSRFMYI